MTAAESLLNSQAAKGAATGAAASVPSIVMGAQVDALFIGLAAAVFVAIWIEQINSRAKAAAAVMLSALMAGYGSPVAARWVADTAPALAADADALRLLLAVLIGVFTPTAIPIAIQYLGRKGGGL